MSIAVILLGLFIVSLGLRRREATYAVFGFAAVLWGVETIRSLLPFALLPQPHREIWWSAIHMTFVALPCLFCARFAEVSWRPCRRVVVAFAPAPVDAHA